MKLFSVLVLVVCPLGILAQFNMTAYRRMPPLYMLDDYDVCLDEPEPSSYCLVIAEIVPDNTSALYTQIVEFSSVTKYHYDHKLLYFGKCLNPCKMLVDSLNSTQKDDLNPGIVQSPELVEFYTDINRRDADKRALYGDTIAACINYNFKEKYGLQVRTFTQYCDSNDAPKGFEFLEIVLMVLVGTLTLLVILSSNYDRQLKNKQPPNLQSYAFYQELLHTQRDTILTSFSIYRNYYRLITPPRGATGRDLRFFESFRFFATLMVVLGHMVLILKAVPLSNTEFVEKLFYNLGVKLVLNGNVIIQTFLVMSSFLLTVHFQQRIADKSPGVGTWAKLVYYRYLRLVPSLGFMILLNASILPRLQDGPFWRQLTEGENVMCKETWWANLLFINNFTLRKSCLQQTWYIAADTQLYLILVAVLIFIARFPQTKKYIFAGGVLLSFLSTGMVTYFLKLEAVHQENPEGYRYQFWRDGATMYHGYTPFYTNFGGFVFGAAAGFLYLRYKDEGIDLKGKKSIPNRIFLMCIPVPFLLLLSGEIFFRITFVKPSIWVGIYGGIYRNVWAFMCATLILSMAFKIGLILYRFCSMKIFTSLGRLSFQVYLVHTLVIRCLVGWIRQPIYTNALVLLIYILASIVISFAAAYFLYTFIELPLTILVNITIKQRGVKTQPPATNTIIPNHLGDRTKEDTATT